MLLLSGVIMKEKLLFSCVPPFFLTISVRQQHYNCKASRPVHNISSHDSENRKQVALNINDVNVTNEHV